jgi:hypothetical protein
VGYVVGLVYAGGQMTGIRIGGLCRWSCICWRTVDWYQNRCVVSLVLYMLEDR